MRFKSAMADAFIFFKVSADGPKTVSVLGYSYVDGRGKEMLYLYHNRPELPAEQVAELGISGIELSYRKQNISSTIQQISDTKQLPFEVDYTCSQEKTNDGKCLALPAGIYAMAGNVILEAYEVFVTRTGYARIMARSADDANLIADDLCEGEISWTDTWEHECVFSDDQSE